MKCNFLSTAAIWFAAFLFLTLTGCEKDENVIENFVPIVNAGPNQQIAVHEAELSGTATDEDGQVVAYLWSQIEGPSESLISNPGSPKTLVKNLTSGTYKFQLMATDNKGAVGVSTVIVKMEVYTLTLQPADNSLEYKLVLKGLNSWAQSSNPDMPIEQWTDGGANLTCRIATKFDLSTIPTNATILSAKLFLYSHPAPLLNGNYTDANYGSTNSFVVQRISANWDPLTFQWNNQPAVSTTSQVVVPITNESFKDLELDVKEMVQGMIAVNSNHGFYMRLQNEQTYNCRIFVGSFTTKYPDKRPKLVVTYK